MSIHKKLLLTFIVFSGVLIISMALLVKWSFQYNFRAYVKEQNLSRLQEGALRLADYYAQHGNWNSLQNDPPQLRQLMRRPSPLSGPPGPPLPDEYSTSAPPPAKSMRLFFLLDAEHRLLLGKAPQHIQPHQLAPITVGGQPVGYLGYDLDRRVLSHMDERFAQRQGRQLLLISITGIILSLLFAWPLSRFLVARLDQLGQQIHHLSEGRYDARVALSGEDELSRLGTHLNHLALTLQQTEQSRRKWVADISHELRTPLATLRAQLEAIEDGVHTYNERTHQRLVQQTQRLQQLVEDLYQLSLADVGALQYRKQPCDPIALVQDCVEEFRDAFAKAGITLDTDIRLTPGLRLLADPQRLHQLLCNLLENSLRYTHPPGAAFIRAHQDHDQLIISVEDTSPGVSEVQLNHLFERFYRGESSRNRETGGAGLGLNLCRSIVEAHAGSISASASRLSGLAVTVTLPVRTA